MTEPELARVVEIPDCDICRALYYSKPEKAVYDAKTFTGKWAYVCERHFRTHTPGRLGVGVGQRLALVEKERGT